MNLYIESSANKMLKLPEGTEKLTKSLKPV